MTQDLVDNQIYLSGSPLVNLATNGYNIGASDMMTIKTNNGQFHSEDLPQFGRVETMDPISLELLNDVRNDAVDNFVLNHSDWVSQS